MSINYDIILSVIKMGIFDKLKNALKTNKNNNKEINEYCQALTKTRSEFVSSLEQLSDKHKKIDPSYFESLEELLIMADMGTKIVNELISKLNVRIRTNKITNPSDLIEIIVDELFMIYVQNDIITSKLNYNPDGPTVILLVGVNGVGKTTTIAKLAYLFKNDHKKVRLIAGDTFRAGAQEQLENWAHKLDVNLTLGDLNSDPSSVMYKGIHDAVASNDDIILIDTAGRLQTKVNLMSELSKINKVLGTLIPNAPHETLLVIDATTGQNGISQAKSFSEITNITGIVLTKLDGTAKGGIVLAIKEATTIPVKFIGLGEHEQDLKPFDIEKYIYGLFKELIK